MLRKTLALSVAALFVAGAAFAAPKDKNKKPKPTKVVEVMNCPMTGDKGSTTDTSLIRKEPKAGTYNGKTYNVHFCCNGCPEAFEKLPVKDQEAKINAAMKAKGKKTAVVEPVHLTVVNTCPMTGEAIKGEGAGMSKVGNYEVHFCCAGCKPQFDNLTEKQKLEKIQTALAK